MKIEADELDEGDGARRMEALREEESHRQDRDREKCYRLGKTLRDWLEKRK